MLNRRCVIGSSLVLAACGLFAFAGAPAATSQAESLKIDSVHSSMAFRVKHMNAAYFYGRFNDIKGQINWDEANPASSSIEVAIKAESVDTGNKKRDDHLRSQDFFNASKFETLTFKSTGVAKAGETTYDVKGDLTLHGQTKPITVKLEKTGEAGKKVGFETVFTIKRSDFGMNFMLENLGDEIRVMMGIEADKQ
jgi:polyisoprenoid-binding protein YceI